MSRVNSNKHEKLEDVFIEIAKKESDCSSHERGGDLGHFGHGKMQKSFEKAAYVFYYYYF